MLVVVELGYDEGFVRVYVTGVVCECVCVLDCHDGGC